MRKLPLGTWILIAMFSISGVLHIVNPEGFAWLMWPMNEILFILLITFSGIAEIACALGLFIRHPLAGKASALILVLVWPANIFYAFNLAFSGGELGLTLLAFARLPVQILLIWWALKSPKRLK
jgi:uncharacterized membrane protein